MKKISFILILLINTNLILSQYLEVKWSNIENYNDKENGKFHSFLGQNNNCIYSINQGEINKTDGIIKQFKLVAYDKKTISKVQAVSLKGYEENKLNEKEGINYFKTIICFSKVFIFYKKKGENNENLYVEVFDSKLQKIKDLSLLQTIDLPKDITRNKFVKSEDITFFTVLSKNTESNQFTIGWEKLQKEKKCQFSYITYDENLTKIHENSVELQTKVDEKYTGLTCDYQLCDNDILVIEPQYKTTDFSVIRNIISFVDLTNNEIQNINFKVDQNAPQYLNSIKVFKLNDVTSIFSCQLIDFSADPNFGVIKGIYTVRLEKGKIENSKEVLNIIDQGMSNSLYRYDVNKTLSGIIEIDTIVSNSIGNIIICLTNNNHSFQMNRCYNNRITLLNFDQDGSVKWTSKIDRNAVFPWMNYHDDVRIISNEDKMVLIYANGTENKSEIYTSPWTYDHIYEQCSIDMINGKMEKPNQIDFKKWGDNDNEKSIVPFIPTSIVSNNELLVNYYNYKKNMGCIGIVNVNW